MSLWERWFGRVPGEARDDDPRLGSVREVIDTLRPLVRADGGDVELVGLEDDWVVVRLSGACTHCHASSMTIDGLLEPRLRQSLPWVRGVRLA